MIKKGLYVIISIIIVLALLFIYKISNSMEKIETYFVTKDFQSKFNVNSSSNETKEENLKKLKEDNSDIIGWINIPDTDINFPIVQTFNNEYYQTHNLNLVENKNGSIYMDYRNNIYEDGQNYVIYGNDLLDDLTAFKYQDYYDKHYEINFVTDKGDFRAFVFSVYEVHQNHSLQDIYWRSKKERTAFLNVARERSVILSDITILDEENILTLITKSDWSDDVSLIVHAVIMDPNIKGPSDEILQNKMDIEE